MSKQEKPLKYKKINTKIVAHCIDHMDKKPLHELVHVQPCRSINKLKEEKNIYIEVGLNIDAAFEDLYDYIISETNRICLNENDKNSHKQNIRKELVKLLESDILGHEVTILILKKLNEYDFAPNSLDNARHNNALQFNKIAVNVSLKSINDKRRWDAIEDILIKIEKNENLHKMLQFEFPVPTHDVDFRMYV